MVDVETLMPLLVRLIEQDIPEAVKIIEGFPRRDASDILLALPGDLTARVINRLQVNYTASLLEQNDPVVVKKIIAHIAPRQAASIVMHLSPDARSRLMPHISGSLANEIREMLTYPEGSVGRYMSADFLTFKKNESAGNVIENIRKMAEGKNMPASYTYVVDDEDTLLGVLNTRDLMLATPDQRLETFMIGNVFSLHCFTDRTEAAREMAKRKYFAAPIVDGENRIVGIIRAESMLHGLKEDISRDMQTMFGVGKDERTFSPLGFALKKRLLWLTVNLATAFLAASVVAVFEGIIAKLTILAVFLPVIAGQGGNAGAQSLAVVMRGLVMREIPAHKVKALILKETKLGVMNGLIIGLITALIAWVWYGNPWLGVVIGLGMVINLAIAGLTGSSIPIIMKKLGIDPAQSSSIILTTVTDVMGFLAFLGLAVLFQGYLL
ncbi:MAG: magnesium transporter [Desulforhopalus sp.]